MFCGEGLGGLIERGYVLVDGMDAHCFLYLQVAGFPSLDGYDYTMDGSRIEQFIR